MVPIISPVTFSIKSWVYTVSVLSGIYVLQSDNVLVAIIQVNCSNPLTSSLELKIVLNTMQCRNLNFDSSDINLLNMYAPVKYVCLRFT